MRREAVGEEGSTVEEGSILGGRQLRREAVGEGGNWGWRQYC